MKLDEVYKKCHHWLHQCPKLHQHTIFDHIWQQHNYLDSVWQKLLLLACFEHLNSFYHEQTFQAAIFEIRLSFLASLSIIKVSKIVASIYIN